MNPDIDLRLKSVMKALTDVILPALPAEERLAREQANLVLGHVRIIAEQWQHALNLELLNLALACELASELAAMNFDSALGDDLIAALARAADVDRGNYAAVSDVHRKLKAVIDRLLAPEHPNTGVPPAMMAAVLRYNRQRAERERIWHRAAGLDPDAGKLPPIASLFDVGSR